MVRDYGASLSRAVDKATDATLLSDNWQYILDVCDKVSEDPEDGSRQVISLVEKRLQQRDANVQLRALSLLTSIAENCGSRVKQEIATKSFTTVLLNKLREPTVHKEIKVKVVQVLTQLSDSFKNDPSLRPVQDAYNEVQRNYSQYFPPDKPQKQNLSNDRLKEEEDLKAAIALSLAENNQAPIPTQQDIQQIPQQVPQQQQQQQQAAAAAAPAPVAKQQSFSRVRALYDSFSQDPADLHFRKGDIITVLDRVYKDWGKGSLRGEIGLFPFNYVTPLYDPTPEELLVESEKETKILLQARQVERLLVLLSSGNDEVISSNEFQQLYQEIAMIKPELGGLIEKYRVRRDELLDLHGKLKDATVKYEELTDPLKKANYGSYPPPPQTSFPNTSGYQYQQPQPQHQHQTPHQHQQTPQTPQTPQVSQPQASQPPLSQYQPQYPQYQQQAPQQSPQQAQSIPPIPQAPSLTGGMQRQSYIQPQHTQPSQPSQSLASPLQQQNTSQPPYPQY